MNIDQDFILLILKKYDINLGFKLFNQFNKKDHSKLVIKQCINHQKIRKSLKVEKVRFLLI